MAFFFNNKLLVLCVTGTHYIDFYIGEYEISELLVILT